MVFCKQRAKQPRAESSISPEDDSFLHATEKLVLETTFFSIKKKTKQKKLYFLTHNKTFRLKNLFLFIFLYF